MTTLFSLDFIENSDIRFICQFNLRDDKRGLNIKSTKFHPRFYLPSYLKCTFGVWELDETKDLYQFKVFLHLCEESLEAPSSSQKSSIFVQTKVVSNSMFIDKRQVRSDSINDYPLELYCDERPFFGFNEECYHIRVSISLKDPKFIFSEYCGFELRECRPDTPDLVKDFKHLYHEGTFSDVTFSIKDKIFQAHKLILAARSSVFQKMLEPDRQKSSCNNITIIDCDYQTFDKFLMYLYTGEMEDESLDTAVSLYSLAIKYDVRGLKTVCVRIIQDLFFTNHVDSLRNSVCAILLLSHRHNNKILKNLAVRFIVNNFSQVGSKEDWKEIMREEQELSSDILVQVSAACGK